MKHKADEVGTKVYKPSGKPFKSGEKVNTIKGITINPHTNEPAYTFEEDESIVDARSCEPVQYIPFGY